MEIITIQILIIVILIIVLLLIIINIKTITILLLLIIITILITVIIEGLGGTRRRSAVFSQLPRGTAFTIIIIFYAIILCSITLCYII